MNANRMLATLDQKFSAPAARLLVIVRDPIDYRFSHYFHMVDKRAFETPLSWFRSAQYLATMQDT